MEMPLKVIVGSEPPNATTVHMAANGMPGWLAATRVSGPNPVVVAAGVGVAVGVGVGVDVDVDVAVGVALTGGEVVCTG
jgi:hypothetical protein